jgi:hypothetical protein
VCDSEVDGERGPDAGVLQNEAPDQLLPLVRSPTPRMLAHALASRQSRFLISSRSLLAGHSIVVGGLSGQFARPTNQLQESHREGSNRKFAECSWEYTERINPSLGQGDFSRTSTPAIFACYRCASYSMKTNTLSRAQPTPARPSACSSNDGAICL